MWQAYVRFKSGSTTRADVADSEDDARKALEDAMSQLKSNGIGTVGPSLVATKGSGASSSPRESLRAIRDPLKIAKLDSHLALSHARSVRVELHVSRPARARALVARRGGRVEASYGDLVDAVVPTASLDAL